jgi:hypothetical protein
LRNNGHLGLRTGRELLWVACFVKFGKNGIWSADYQFRQGEKVLPQIAVFAIIEPFRFEETQTVAWIQPCDDTGLIKIGHEFIGVIDERLSDAHERRNTVVATLYKIGHTADSSRDPFFTTKKEKAAFSRDWFSEMIQ